MGLILQGRQSQSVHTTPRTSTPGNPPRGVVTVSLASHGFHRGLAAPVCSNARPCTFLVLPRSADTASPTSPYIDMPVCLRMRIGDVLEVVAREKHFLDYHPPSLLLHSYSLSARMTDSSLLTLTTLRPTPPGVSGGHRGTPVRSVASALLTLSCYRNQKVLHLLWGETGLTHVRQCHKTRYIYTHHILWHSICYNSSFPISYLFNLELLLRTL